MVPGLTVAALASVLSIEGASAAEPLAWGSASQQAHALAQADRRVSLTQLTLAASAAALVVATGWWMWPVAPITATEDPLVAEAPAALLHRPSDWIPAAVPFSLHLLDGERTRQRLSHSVYGSLALVAGSNAQQIADAGFTWATQCLSLFGRGPGLVSGAQRGMSWSGHGLRGCSLSLDKLSPEVPAPQNEVFLPEIFGAKMSMIMPNRFRFGAALSCTDPSFSTFLEPWLQGPIPASPWSGSRSGLDLSIDAPFYRIGSASTDPAPLAPVQPDPAADLMFYEGLDSCSWRILPDNGCHGVRLCSDPDIPRMAGLAKPLERNAIIRAPDGSLAIYVRSGDDLAVPIRRWMVEALRMVVPPSDDQHGQLHQTLAARHDHLDQLLADHSFPKDLTVHGTFSVAIGWDGLWPWVAIEAETTPEEAAAWLAGTEQWSHMSEKATFAENFYLKMFTLVAGYQEGRLRMTTHAAGLAAWHGAGAFARQPDVQTALAHIPADAEGCVVVREQALATVLCQFMGWMYHADQDTTSTTPLWKTVPTGSFAARIRTAAPEIVRLLANTHGVVWMRHEPGGLHVEAEGPLTGLLIPLWPVLFGGSVPLRQFAN